MWEICNADPCMLVRYSTHKLVTNANLISSVQPEQKLAGSFRQREEGEEAPCIKKNVTMDMEGHSATSKNTQQNEEGGNGSHIAGARLGKMECRSMHDGEREDTQMGLKCKQISIHLHNSQIE